jgi:hypothetical protein
MVFINNGQVEITDAIAALMIQGQWGSDGTIATEGDSGLISPIAATQLATQVTKTQTSIQVIHTTLSTIGNGSTFQEFALQSNTIDLVRSTVTAISKTADKDIIVTATINVSYN